MRSYTIIAVLVAALTCGLFALAKAAPADVLRDYQSQLRLAPCNASIGPSCGCLGCSCGCK